MILGACHVCKTPQCEWTSVRCSKGAYCMEIFCFACLSKTYPTLYGGVFRGISWACPACLDACKCETCTDPVKRHELQALACEEYAQQRERVLFLAAQQQYQARQKEEKDKEKEKEKAASLSPCSTMDIDNSWSCPRCSVLNNADDIECNACLYHKRRSTRKRAIYSATNYEDRHSSQKEPVKRARENPIDDPPPQKGRVSALRQLVKNPWTDGWELARKLALDLVEEAKQQAIRQGIPVLQVRQLPTKYQLANSRGTHVRKWFDREPTLAKKFLRAAGLICSKSNGTFINQDILHIDDLPPLIMKADLSRYDENSSFSDDGEDSGKLRGSVGSMSSISASGESSASSSPNLSPMRSPSRGYQPKLKVYYHRADQSDPFVFKVPINDLNTIEEVKDRLGVLLQDMGQTSTEDDKKSFVLTAAGVNDTSSSSASSASSSSSSCVTQNLPCNTMDELTRCSLLHVHAP